MNSPYKENTIAMKHCLFGYSQGCFCIMRALVDVIIAIFKILYGNLDPNKIQSRFGKHRFFFKRDKILLLTKRGPLVTG